MIWATSPAGERLITIRAKICLSSDEEENFNIKLYLFYSWQLCATLATIIFMIHAEVSLITKVPQFCLNTLYVYWHTQYLEKAPSPCCKGENANAYQCFDTWNTIDYKWAFQQAVSIQRVLKARLWLQVWSGRLLYWSSPCHITKSITSKDTQEDN